MYKISQFKKNYHLISDSNVPPGGFFSVPLPVGTAWIVPAFELSEFIIFVFDQVSDDTFGSFFLVWTAFGASAGQSVGKNSCKENKLIKYLF